MVVDDIFRTLMTASDESLEIGTMVLWPVNVSTIRTKGAGSTERRYTGSAQDIHRLDPSLQAHNQPQGSRRPEPNPIQVDQA